MDMVKLLSEKGLGFNLIGDNNTALLLACCTWGTLIIARVGSWRVYCYWGSR